MDAVEAERLGLVSRVVPHDRLAAETRALADEIAANAPLAVQSAKRLLTEQQHMTFEQAMQQTAFFLTTLRRRSEDHLEGATAFLERRPAVFRGR
ncbi:MAG: enoyl-CoA hydratase-related protein [Dehalococcoidia bacterium]